jgi:hypothetical protein
MWRECVRLRAAETAIPYGSGGLLPQKEFGDIGYASNDLIEHGYRLERRDF